MEKRRKKEGWKKKKSRGFGMRRKFPQKRVSNETRKQESNKNPEEVIDSSLRENSPGKKVFHFLEIGLIFFSVFRIFILFVFSFFFFIHISSLSGKFRRRKLR